MTYAPSEVRCRYDDKLMYFLSLSLFVSLPPPPPPSLSLNNSLLQCLAKHQDY